MTERRSLALHHADTCSRWEGDDCDCDAKLVEEVRVTPDPPLRQPRCETDDPQLSEAKETEDVEAER